MQLVSLVACPAAPWRNGAGVTRELARGAGWRLSLADIDRDGPFSSFPGLVREFAVVRGALALRFGARELVLDEHSAPIRFDGADVPVASLRGAGRAAPALACRALNLMCERGRAAGRLQRHALAAGESLGGVALDGVAAVHVQSGELRAGDRRAAAGDTLLLGDADREAAPPALVAASAAPAPTVAITIRLANEVNR